MIFEKKLTIPKEVKEMYPVSDDLKVLIAKREDELKAIFSGESKKKVLIIGPCSADNEDSVIDYISRLRDVQEEVKDKVFIVPRVYTNKPRTNGDGYKGFVHQPDPESKPDVFKGIIATRQLHMNVIKETGFSCADEMLYPDNYRYLDDLLAYMAIGARSVENQEHRLTTSGLGIPVGMKNPTSGTLSIMFNAIYMAQNKHSFIYRGWAVHSQGNPYAHAILRGYTTKQGTSHPNYHYEDLVRVKEFYDEKALANPAVIIDTNHANSGKNPFEQPRIIDDVLNSCRHNAGVSDLVKGFMVESYIEDGAQRVGEHCYGKSITDACLGWEKSKRLIYNIAEKL